MFRLIALLASIVLLAACTNPNDLDEAPVDLGDFRLGHNVVVASKMTRGPVSREASAEEWKDALTSAIAERFGRYEGDRLYHLGVSVEGYVLAQPGIPIVASPNSVLILLVTVWDDAASAKMNTPPEQITVIETISGEYDPRLGPDPVERGADEQPEPQCRQADREFHGAAARLGGLVR